MKKSETVKLIYSGPHEAVIVPDANLTAVRGEVVSIPAELAVSLLKRDHWKAAETPGKGVK